MKKKILVGELSIEDAATFVEVMSNLKVSSDGRLDIIFSDHDAEESTWKVTLSVHHDYIEDMLRILTDGCRDRWSENFFIEVIKNSEILRFNLSNYHLLSVGDAVSATDLVWLGSEWKSVNDKYQGTFVKGGGIVLRYKNNK